MTDPGDLPFRSAATIARWVRGGNISPTTVVETFLDRIDAIDPDLNAFVTVLHEQAREDAERAEAERNEGNWRGPLHGVPVAIKDLTHKAGVPTTFGSVPFANFVPEEDAVVVQRLEAAGAIVIGKTNTPEFGHKGTTINDLCGRTANPFDHDRTAGGSSGGSAAAVAAGLVPIAQGSDAAGSIRIPASACGVVGFKPSTGRVPAASRPNAFANQTPFIDLGPITRTIEDAALMQSVIAGPDPSDPRSLPDDGVSYRSAVEQPIPPRELAIGFAPDLGLFPVDSTVRRIVRAAIERLEGAGATVEETALEVPGQRGDYRESFQMGLQARFAATYENLREAGTDLMDHRDVVNPVLFDRIEAGRDRGAVEYVRAGNRRTEMYDAVEAVLDTHDVLVTPTLAVPPFEDGAYPFPTQVDGEEIHPHLEWAMTWPFNMTGHPIVALPAGWSDAGLPIGLQIVGPRFRDDMVLATARTFELLLPWRHRYT